MDEDRFNRKRNSLVGGGLAKFEGAQAADQFARRQSSYQNRVRQSIPDIRFDENGMPISTRQLQARSHSLVAGSLYSRDGYRRGSEQLIGGEKNVRKLSKKFSAEEEEEMKANFTIPSNSRAGMFGTNRRWNVKPEWMKKRKSSLKEEFIEKNLSNLELLSPTSPKEMEEEMSSILEEMAPPSGEKTGSASDDVDGGDHTDGKESRSRSSASETDSSEFSEEGSDSEGEDSNSDGAIEEDESRDVDADATNDREEDDTAVHREGSGEVLHLENKCERKILKSSKKKRRKSKRSKKSGSNDDMPPRPPPPPLPIQMCDVSDFIDASSSSDDEDGEVIRTQYGKQKLFVSKFDHVFQNSNGPLLDGQNKIQLSKISVRTVN